MLSMQTHWSHFDNLTPHQLYEMMVLRQRVFGVEQNCAYLDADGVDLTSWHLTLKKGDQVMAYLRLVPPGVKYDEPSLGRVVTAPEARGMGLGKVLMIEGLKKAAQEFPGMGVRISAQAYLERFYTELGFTTIKGPYLEDGIPHLEMLNDAPRIIK